MARRTNRHALQSSPNEPTKDVLILADIVGRSEITLMQVLEDFLKIVTDPVIAGGLAMAHHGHVRATVDIDVIAIGSVLSFIEKFKALGFKHESVDLPIGRLDLMTKGNKGVDFIHLNDEDFLRAILKRAGRGTLGGAEVRYVSLEDLILLKMLAVKGRSGRYDAGDLQALLEKPHDRSYINRFKVKLGLS